jgi:hypothetical protein
VSGPWSMIRLPSPCSLAATSLKLPLLWNQGRPIPPPIRLIGTFNSAMGALKCPDSSVELNLPDRWQAARDLIDGSWWEIDECATDQFRP